MSETLSPPEVGPDVSGVFEHPDEVERVVKRSQDVYLAHRWSEERRGLTGAVALLAAGAR